MSKPIALQTVKGVCPHDCPDTCGFVVTVKEGKAVDFRGDKDHPFTKGFLCRKVANYLERVYHPERLQYPMKRTGPKGSGQFERISWASAIAEIAAKFRAIIASPEGPQAILPYSYAGTMGKLQSSSLDRRFFHSIGASLLDRTICASAGGVGSEMTLGSGRAVIDPEAVVHSRYIINWGSNTSVTNSHLWAIMHQARKRGAKIVTIDPYQSPTAKKSDWWIPIRPGTDAALALGMMHILFHEGWIDADYLEKHCLGTDELRSKVEREYPLDKVSAITGIPIADIEKLTEEYAKSPELFGGPSLIRLNYGMQRHGGGGMAVRTVCCLPAIVGAWRHAGGGALLSTSRLSPFDMAALERPDLIPLGTRTINMVQLAEALNHRLPGPPVNALYVYNSNPASVCPDQSQVIEGLKREDLFTVVHEQFLTDTARYADIVLPATTQLEHFDIHNAYGQFYVQSNNPAIAPLHEAKANNDVFRLLAKAMNLKAELFEIDDEELARQCLQPTDGPRGYPYKSAFDGVTLEATKVGPVRLNVPVDYAPYADGQFGTPSGKCEFYSERMKQLGFDPLPTYIAPHEGDFDESVLSKQFPLQMITPPEPAFLNSSFANQERNRNEAVEPRMEIHRSDAELRQIVDGDIVQIRSERGSYRCKAIVGESMMPGVIAVLGCWWNKDTLDGANCNVLTSTKLTDLGGGATFFDNRVEVVKA